MADPKVIKYHERFKDHNGEFWECIQHSNGVGFRKVEGEGVIRRHAEFDLRRKSRITDRRTAE